MIILDIVFWSFIWALGFLLHSLFGFKRYLFGYSLIFGRSREKQRLREKFSHYTSFDLYELEILSTLKEEEEKRQILLELALPYARSVRDCQYIAQRILDRNLKEQAFEKWVQLSFRKDASAKVR